MRRWFILSLLIYSFGCSTAPRAVADDLPEKLGEQWTRTALDPLAAQLAPDQVRELGLDEAAHATYAGPASVGVRVFRMRAGASAFELMQRWRQDQGLATYSGRYFLVADTDASPEHARLLLQALQAALPQ